MAKRLSRTGRRWWQYSLGTLLGVVTLACACLAAVNHYVEPWLADRAAAQKIAEAGGSCELSPEGPDLCRTWFGPDVLQRITAVDLSQPQTTAACLTILPRLRRLEKATLSGAKFTDEQLAALGQLERLRELTLRGTTVTAERVAELRAARPNLVLTVEPLEISFESDLKFDAPKGEPFSRDHLTERIRCLDGSPVRIRGYMMPTSTQFGIRRFVIESDNMYGSFRVHWPVWDAIIVETSEGSAVDFSVRRITLEGILTLNEYHDPESKRVLSIYRMTGASVPGAGRAPGE